MTTDTVPKRTHHTSAVHEPAAAIRATGIVVVLTVVLAILAIAFALPAARSKPHDIPIGAAGPMAASGQVADILEQHAPGVFAITYYPGEAALRDAIRNRDVYGGISFGAGADVAGQAAPEGRTLLIATGGSPMVAQMLTQIGNGIAQQAGVPLHTEDLAPPTADDPRGAGWPLRRCRSPWPACCPRSPWCCCSSAKCGRASSPPWCSRRGRASRSPRCCATCSAPSTTTSGASRPGSTLGLLAAGLSMLGLGSLFGRGGLAVGALLALLLGNPLSGLNSAPEMLPSGWGTLGQWLPQGATATLLRSTAFFDGAGATTAIAVLTCWAVAGTALIVIAAVRRGGPRPP